MLLSQNVLVTTEKNVIAIRYIECLHLQDDVDRCIDKLQDDIVIPVTMISGKSHRVSIKEQIESFKNNGMPLNLVRAQTAIFEKWTYLIGTTNGNIAT